MLIQFKNKFSHKGAVDFLIAGLGNPGDKFTGTRHNIGFAAVDVISQKIGAAPVKIKFEGLTCQCELDGVKLLLLKPQTFMNLSGKSVAQALRYYKLPPERLLVLFDDISLPTGKLRIRRNGSDGGHNGIKSIVEHLGSEEFPRIKIGVGAKPHPEMDLADWVLSKFRKEEQALLPGVLDSAYEAMRLMVTGNINEAMNRFN